MTSRFFVPPEQIRNNTFVLLGTEARHAALVLRKITGDVLDLFDGRDLSFQGRIDLITPERIEGTILSQTPTGGTMVAHLTLYQALIKGSRWDWLVEKACEIGVTKLVPLLTARTVVKSTHTAPLDRWRRVALAASKQCGRSDVMEITEPKPFLDAIKKLPEDGLALIPWEKEQERTIHSALSSSPAATGGGPIIAVDSHDGSPTTASGMTRNVHLFIGPEGGWDSQEIDMAVRRGIVPVTLGPTLLRSETAGLVAAILIFSECGVYS